MKFKGNAMQESKNEANSNNILEETRDLPGDKNVENKQKKTHICSNNTLSKIKEDASLK